MMFTLASKIKDTDISRIQNLEKELGIILLAYSSSDVRPDNISNEKLKKIQTAEKELGLSLVAVKP